MKQLRRNPLYDWLRIALNDPDKEGPCTAIALVKSDRGLDTEVTTKRFHSGQQWTVEGLAEELYNRAKEDCKDDKGIEHTYKLLPFYGKDVPEGEKRFKLTPYGEDVELLNEAPDARGALAQAMRLSEGLVQGAFRLITQVHGSAATELQDLRKENRELFTMVKDTMVKLVDSQYERELKLEEFKRDTAERRQWLQFAPALMNTVLGRDVFPQSTVDTALVEGVAESLSEEDLQLLATKIKPELWGPLAARLEKFHKEKKKAKDEAERTLRLVAINEDPEANAAGD